MSLFLKNKLYCCKSVYNQYYKIKKKLEFFFDMNHLFSLFSIIFLYHKKKFKYN